MVLKRSISGIRGIVGVSLTPELCEEAAAAFAVYSNGRNIVVGTDTRASRAILKEAVAEGLKKAGCNVLDLGIIPTPTVALMVKELGASGGIVITASHNPAEWNGLKFISHSGVFLTQKEAEEFFKVLDGETFKKAAERGADRSIEEPFEPHLKRIFKNIDVELIGSKNFKVALDCVNGAGSVILPRLLKELGCRVFTINTDINIPFPHNPEPTPENIQDLCRLTKKEGADLGIAVDPDGDRVAFVTERGDALSEEYSLALAVRHVLSRSNVKGATVVKNLSTTSAIDKIANTYGAKVISTKVGEINVACEMMRSGALIGGEGNGGVIWPPVCMNRDSLTGTSLILEFMAGECSPISVLAGALPPINIQKEKFKGCGSPEEAGRLIEEFKKLYRANKMDLMDGVKVIFDDSWLHVRASNTEPVIRIIAEAGTRKETAELIDKTMRWLRERL